MDKTLQENLDRILNSPSYRVAYRDVEFLDQPALRPVRIQLELLKPEMAFQEQRVSSTIVVFGGTQLLERSLAEAQVGQARKAMQQSPQDPLLKRKLFRAEQRLENARFYDEAREFARMVSSTCQVDGKCDYVIVTGGGPGIMEAANRGAHDVGAKTVGLNITLPEEQLPNPYITPQLCFQFDYFAIRKMHFLMRAKALVTFPGGFGTIDELFDALTLRQTHRMQAIPIILYGRKYWETVLNLPFLADQGVIADEHLDLVDYAETPEEAWEIVRKFHQGPPRPK